MNWVWLEVGTFTLFALTALLTARINPENEHSTE